MKKVKLLIGSVLIAASITAISGNGNGPNSGSGGNSSNKGNAGPHKILHHHGNGTYSIMFVTDGALAGHGSHGDLWYHSGMPVSP